MPSAVVLLAPRRRPRAYRAALGDGMGEGPADRGRAGGGETPHVRRGAPVAASEFRLLVVDDDRLMTDLLPKKLARAMRGDVRILTAASAVEAQRIIEREQPHAVVSDFNLREDWTGLDVLRHAKEHAPGCARILFSGHTRSEIGGPLDDAAVDGYIEKPMRLDELVPSLLDLLRASTGLDLRREGAGRA